MRLVLPDGEQVSLATGRIFDKSNGKEVSRFFTNRTGRLVAEGLAPGTYVMQLDGLADVSATFIISDDETGIVQRGAVTMEVMR